MKGVAITCAVATSVPAVIVAASDAPGLIRLVAGVYVLLNVRAFARAYFSLVPDQSETSD